jgi:hypothetical protein
MLFRDRVFFGFFEEAIALVITRGCRETRRRNSDRGYSYPEKRRVTRIALRMMTDFRFAFSAVAQVTRFHFLVLIV